MNIDTGLEDYTAPRDHSALRKMVTKYLDATKDNADLARRDRDYFDGDQISGDKLAELKQRGQPPMVDNKIKAGIDGLLGLYDAGATDPEALPRNYGDQDAANVATKTLRYVADRLDFPTLRKNLSKPFFVEGVGAAIYGWDGREVTGKAILWEDLIYDPFSREHDFSDAQYMGIGKLLDVEDVDAMFPGKRLKAASSGEMADFFDDKSKRRWWGDGKLQVRVIDLYYDTGADWHRAIFTESDVLYVGAGEFHDDHGETFCPIVGATHEIKRDGSRYGVARQMISLQDSVNSRQSRLLHLVNHRQSRVTDMYAAVTDKDIARREAAKADGVLPFGYEPIQNADMAQGQMMVLQQSLESLNRLCPTPAVLGQITSANQSGRARQILQQAGYTELARSFSRLEALERRSYGVMWWIAREFIDAPRVIRITDDPRAPEFMKVNEPVMGPVMQPVTGPDGQPQIDPMTGQPMVAPAMGVTGFKNRLADLDMDIIVSTTPDTQSLQQEVIDKLMDTAASTRMSPLDPAFDVFIEMSAMPNKREVRERIKRLKAEAASENAEGAQAQQAAAEAGQQADVAAKAAKAAKDNAVAQKTHVETAAMLIPQTKITPGYGEPYPGLN
jgi:uncharacterized Zn finger protein (UPF0148 family)